MIRFTTPRQEFSFSINPQENFNRIVISYAQRGKIVIEKEKSDLTFSTDGEGDDMVTIGYKAYAECTQLRKVWIRDTVKTINSYVNSDGSKKDSGVFYGCSDDLVIYCEADSKPSGWDSEWDAKSGSIGSWVRHTVVWGQKTRPW